MKVKRMGWWIGWAVLLAATTATGAELKIGVINVQRLERESPLADRASKKLEKDAVTMSDTDRRNREGEMGRLSRDFQRLQREYREDLNVRRNEEFQVLFERTSRVIKQIADAEKYDLIIQEAVYASPRVDITDKVLKGLAAEK